MVVVLKELAQSNEVEWQGVLTNVTVIEVLVAVSMATPVDDSPMDRSHEKVNWEEEEMPPLCGDDGVDGCVEYPPENA